MRPVERGEIPVHPETGEPIEIREYSHARGHLKVRIGEYCSYCERRLEYTANVEHVQPKKHHHDLITEWDNFLLACPNCNSIKGDEDVNLEEYVWPDLDNTFLTFRYVNGFVFPAENERKEQAEKMIQLVGLDRTPSSDPFVNPEQTDERWKYRVITWSEAERYLQELEEDVENRERTKGHIRDLAVKSGYWSVWMTVFAEHSDMLEMFIEAFAGTSRACFEEGSFSPIPRNKSA